MFIKKTSKKLGGIEVNEYTRVHNWIRRHFPKKGQCLSCKSYRKTEWALKKGEQYKKVISSFVELCVPCHRKYDITDAIRKKIRIGHLGKPAPWKMKRIAAIRDGRIQIFSCIREAAKRLNICKSGISNVLGHRAHTAGGYKWIYKDT